MIEQRRSIHHTQDRKIALMPMAEEAREPVLPVWAWIVTGLVALYFAAQFLR